MNGQNGGHTANWIMGLAAALLTTMLGGSFLYTWSADQSNVSEKREWRDRHESNHSREVQTYTDNQKRIEEKLDRRYDETQKVLQEILIETLAAKQAAEAAREKKRNP
jgi:hypothetical protein